MWIKVIADEKFHGNRKWKLNISTNTKGIIFKCSRSLEKVKWIISCKYVEYISLKLHFLFAQNLEE